VKRIFRVEILLLAAVALLLVLVAMVPFIGPYLEEARDSEAKAMLTLYYSSQKSYYSAHQEYAEKFESMAFSPEGDLRGQLFTNAENIPQKLRAIMPNDCIPFIEKAHFRVLYLMKGEGEAKFFTINEDKEFKKTVIETLSL
jgi:hypothetical protein